MNILIFILYILLFFIVFLSNYFFCNDVIEKYEIDNNQTQKLTYYDIWGLWSFSNLAKKLWNNLKLIGLTQIQIDNLKLKNDEISKIIVDKINEEIPDGVIVWYWGNIIPNGWYICDGTNNTPDLKNRFILGSKNENDIGIIGGEEKHKLTIDEFPSHTHKLESWADDQGFCWSGKCGISPSDRKTDNKEINSDPYSSNFWSLWMIDWWNYNKNNIDYDQPHENMPPFYTLLYIMKNVWNSNFVFDTTTTSSSSNVVLQEIRPFENGKCGVNNGICPENYCCDNGICKLQCSTMALDYTHPLYKGYKKITGNKTIDSKEFTQGFHGKYLCGMEMGTCPATNTCYFDKNWNGNWLGCLNSSSTQYLIDNFLDGDSSRLAIAHDFSKYDNNNITNFEHIGQYLCGPQYGKCPPGLCCSKDNTCSTNYQKC